MIMSASSHRSRRKCERLGVENPWRSRESRKYQEIDRVRTDTGNLCGNSGQNAHDIIDHAI
jgi:hypothetical protein